MLKAGGVNNGFATVTPRCHPAPASATAIHSDPVILLFSMYVTLGNIIVMSVKWVNITLHFDSLA